MFVRNKNYKSRPCELVNTSTLSNNNYMREERECTLKLSKQFFRTKKLFRMYKKNSICSDYLLPREIIKVEIIWTSSPYQDKGTHSCIAFIRTFRNRDGRDVWHHGPCVFLSYTYHIIIFVFFGKY